MRPVGERSSASGGRTVASVRLTVQEAAEALGVTVEAIRGRMHRGKYLKEKDDEGRVFVLLSPDQLPNGRGEVHERSSERLGSSSGERSDDRVRTDGPTVYKRRDFDAEELVEELRGEVAYLKEIVATRDEELRRKDTIIMQMAQRIPELPPIPSQESLDDHETAAEEVGGVRPSDAAPEPQTGAQRRPWWRRVFGLE